MSERIDEERELIDRVNDGCVQSTHILLERAIPSMQRLARRYISKGVNIEEKELVNIAAQEVIKKIDRFDPHRASFNSFASLYGRLGISEYLQRRSRPVKTPRGSESSFVEHDCDAHDIAINDTSSLSDDSILNDVKSLPKPIRDSINLRFTKELGYAEIGRILGVTHECARQRVMNGLKKLKEMREKREINAIIPQEIAPIWQNEKKKKQHFLLKLMRDRGITHKQIRDMGGFSRRTLTRILNGERQLSKLELMGLKSLPRKPGPKRKIK